MDTSHVVFFFGSGVSIPSDMPDVRTITGGVFNEPIVFSANERYEHCDRAEPAPNSEERVDRVRAFLGIVSNYAQRVLCESGKPDQLVTYEDLYHLCAQVVTDQSGGDTRSTDPFNLAIRPFSEKLKREAETPLLSGSDDRLNNLAYTAREATFLITGVVREMLHSDNVNDESFLPLLKAIDETGRRQKGVEQVTIVTLNHDVLVETLLEKHRDLKPVVNFEDGFGPAEDGVRKYDPERLFNDSARLRLIKPHGSINWYFAESDSNRQRYSDVAIFDGDPFDDGRDYGFYPVTGESSFLSGIGKESSYQSGIFGDMVEAFQHVLRRTTTVIESGFGWQDYGMRSILMRYLTRKKENRLLRLHPKKDPEDPASEIKLPSHAYLKSLRVNSKGGLTPEGLIDGPNYMSHEDVSWTKIKEVLGLP